MVTPCLAREQDKPHVIPGYVPLVKLLCTPNWKTLPLSICPSELRKGFLLRCGKGNPKYSNRAPGCFFFWQQNQLSSENLHTSDKQQYQLVQPPSLALLPVQLLMLPPGEPRNKTTSFSHQFIFQLNEFLSPLCCKSPDSCIRGKDQQANAIHIEHHHI